MKIRSYSNACNIPVPAVAELLEKPNQWHSKRRQSIGGSDAFQIIGENWLPLWELKTGRKTPDDLSGILPVTMGSWTEPLNRYWFQRETSLVVDLDPDQIMHPNGFSHANLDGRVGLGIFEAKHVNAFTNMEAVYKKAYAQIQHNLAVTETNLCYLSVFFGTLKWGYIEVEADAEYQTELMERETEFWSYVENDTPPPVMEAEALPVVLLENMREVNMKGNDDWREAEQVYFDTAVAALRHKKADQTMKALVEPDVRKAIGENLEINRAANNSLRIKKLKEGKDND